jgi:hypothetical protein
VSRDVHVAEFSCRMALAAFDFALLNISVFDAHRTSFRAYELVESEARVWIKGRLAEARSVNRAAFIIHAS